MGGNSLVIRAWESQVFLFYFESTARKVLVLGTMAAHRADLYLINGPNTQVDGHSVGRQP